MESKSSVLCREISVSKPNFNHLFDCKCNVPFPPSQGKWTKTGVLAYHFPAFSDQNATVGANGLARPVATGHCRGPDRRERAPSSRLRTAPSGQGCTSWGAQVCHRGRKGSSPTGQRCLPRRRGRRVGVCGGSGRSVGCEGVVATGICTKKRKYVRFIWEKAIPLRHFSNTVKRLSR